MRLIKAFSLFLLATVVSLSFLTGVLLSSSSVNRFVWSQVASRIGGLSFDGIEGSVLTGLRLQRFRYQQSGVDIEGQQLGVDLSLKCLLQGRLCAEDMTAGQFSFELEDNDNVTDPPDESESAPSVWTPPMPFVIKSLRVSQADFKILGEHFGWQQLNFAGNWQARQITVQSLKLAHYFYQAAPAAEKVKEGTAKAPQLPEQSIVDYLGLISSPYSIRVDKLEAEDGHISVFPESIERLVLHGELDKQRLAVQQLTVKTPTRQLASQGTLELSDDYAADLQLTFSQQQAGEPLRVKFAAKGPARDLKVTSEYSGVADAELSGTLDLSDPKLDFALTLHTSLPQDNSLIPASGQGQLDIAGNLEAYKGQLSGTLKAKKQLSLGGQFAGNWQALSHYQLKLHHEHGQLAVQGQFNWLEMVATLGVQARSLDLSPWSPVAVPLVSGDIQANLNGTKWQLEKADLHGRWQQQPYQLIAHAQGSNWQAAEDLSVNANLGDNHFSLHGHVGQQVALHGRVDFPELKQVQLGVAGQVRGQVDVSGPMLQPTISWDLKGQRMGYHPAQLKMKALVSAGKLELSPQLEGHAELSLNDIEISGQSIDRVQAHYQGDIHQQFSLSAKQAKRALQIAVVGQGSVDRWQGELTQLKAQSEYGDWQLDDATELSWIASKLLLQPFCLNANTDKSGDQDAKFCLMTPLQASADQVSVSGQLKQLPMQLFVGPWLEHWQWQAALSGQFNIDWQLDQPPQAKVQLAISPGTLSRQGGDEPAVSYRYKTLRLGITAKERDMTAKMEFLSDELGRLDSDLSATLDAQNQQQLSGNVALKGLHLAALAPFVPSLTQLTGQVDGNVNVKGALSHPRLNGEVKLADGHIAGPQLPLGIEKLGAKVLFNQSQAKLSGQFESDGHPASWQGNIGWQQGQLNGRIDLQGKQLPIHYDPAHVVVSPKLRIQLSPQQIALSGDIHIDSGLIELEQLPQSAVTLSDDVVIVDQPEQARWSQPLAMNITVDLGDDLKLRAMGLDSGLTGNLHLEQQPQQSLLLTGQVNLEDGRFKAYGQDLQIQSGTLMFSGAPSEPNVQVRAIRDPDNTEDDVTVGVTAEGTPSSMNVQLFSDPAMAQNEQLSYLLRGHGIDSAEDNSALTSLLLSTGINQTGTLVTKLGKQVGVDQLQLSTAGSGDATEVRLSGYLFPGVKVQYGRGVFADSNELTLRYKLLPKFYVEVVSGLESALNFYYEFTIQ